MGGSGSGNYYRFGSRDTVEDCRSIDVRRWQREGWLNPGKSFTTSWSRHGETVASIGVRSEENKVVLNFRHRQRGEEWEDVEEPIRLTWSPCNYGGSRVWFLCPAVGCGRRVAILYGADKYFACRLCYRLPYKSTREGDLDRITRRLDKIRDRLGWEPGFLNGNEWKPKWMRWHTYKRLEAAHDWYVGKANRAMVQRFGLLL